MICKFLTSSLTGADGFVPVSIKIVKMRKLNVDDMHRLDVAAFHAAKKNPVVVVLDNVRSEHNVGSVLRTADAFRIEKVMLCGITGAPPSAEIHKTALGAEDSVMWEHLDTTMQAVTRLREEGYTLLAVEQVEGSHKLGEYAFSPSGKYALVLGNEVKGVAQEVVDFCGEALEIPQYGTKHSLNVSVTAGIVMWAALAGLAKK